MALLEFGCLASAETQILAIAACNIRTGLDPFFIFVLAFDIEDTLASDSESVTNLT